MLADLVRLIINLNTIKMRKKSILTVVVLCLFIFVSCQKDEALIEEQSATQSYPEITEKLEKLHFNTNDLEKVNFQLPDGSFQEMFQVEGDIMFSKEQIESMGVSSGVNTKQYRTNNLVSNGTITIIGYTGGGGFGLSNKERTALQWAVNNYNRLNLDINFSLSFGTNYQSRDMVVYHNPNQSGAGGSAGFPSGGNPFKFVQIYGLNGYNTNVVEHVITHEIGHSVGFRHTDWFSRQSCGQ